MQIYILTSKLPNQEDNQVFPTCLAPNKTKGLHFGDNHHIFNLLHKILIITLHFFNGIITARLHFFNGM